MPFGIKRFNTKKSHPNPRIVFIKALKGPDEGTAQTILERIAAQCFPIMREHSLSVMTVEEFPANREFVGRNFNGGEVIQLVLKAPNGRWLPFRYVQMVMMHELAHCKQMNHSRAFWAVRDGYAAQMQALWGRGYTGEGIWGRGAALGTGEWEGGGLDMVREGDLLAEHLCGGTYKGSRRGQKRKRPVLTYKERKERRIRRKFGEGGVALGADEEVKERLEGKGKAKAKAKAKGKPRVAGSARGRELRAAAALARLEQSQADAAAVKKREEEEEDEEKEDGAEEVASGSEDEVEEEDDDGEEEELAIDVDGKRLVDGEGRGLVRVCEGEDYDADGSGVQGELDELRGMLAGGPPRRKPRDEEAASQKADESRRRPSLQATNARAKSNGNGNDSKDSFSKDSAKTKQLPNAPIDLTGAGADDHDALEAESSSSSSSSSSIRARNSCSMCSFANAEAAVTCAICSNVLDGGKMPNAWRCEEASCRDSRYRNAGDCGVCGLCGQRRAIRPSGS